MYRLLPRYQLTVHKPRPASYPHNPNTIGEHLRKRRMDLGLLQSEVGKLLDVSAASITLWETDKNLPQITYFPRITKFLTYSLWLFDTNKLSGKTLDYRYRNGLSAMILGKILGVASSTVRLWEQEKYVPNNDVMKKLSFQLETPKPLI